MSVKYQGLNTINTFPSKEQKKDEESNLAGRTQEAAIKTTRGITVQVPSQDTNYLTIEEEIIKEWIPELKLILKENSILKELFDDALKFIMGFTSSLIIGAIFAKETLTTSPKLYYSCSMILIVCIALLICRKNKTKITIEDKLNRILKILEKKIKDGENNE